MRVPEGSDRRVPSRRRTFIIGGVVVALIVALILLQSLAGVFTNYLWFRYQGVGEVWRTIIETKLLLGVVFFALSFVLFWVCLFIVDKVAPRAMFMAPDSEFIRRYQAVIGPRATLFRTVVAFILGIALASGTTSQWQHWILFEHAVPFGVTDPQFHRDVSFFVDRLPFTSFLVDWVLGVLLVALLLSAIAYFLNGAIRIQASPHIEPRALAHLSLLLSLMALVRAWAYFYVDRFTLDLAQNGPVAGADYTDVHIRLPAITLLAVISLAAFVLLAINVYQRTIVLPAIAFGLWAVLALLIGVIYPALYQAFKVTPAQSTLELRYISRNIAATKRASGIVGVTSQPFPANQDLTPGVLALYASSLNDVALWDPVYSAATFSNLQKLKSFYSLTNLAVDRYEVNGTTEPVDITVRALNSSGIQRPSWVNSHLQYTHGYGAVVAAANASTSDGAPDFLESDLPLSTSDAALRLTQPRVYFAPGQDTYVIADTRQAEFDYPNGSTGGSVESHYQGSGGIPIGSFLNRAAFAIHLHDFNLLVSSDITSKSRLIYVPDVEHLVENALPFLKIDANPYPVVADGHIDWIVDGYTTSSYYPYAQPDPSYLLPSGTGLSGNYDYVRDAVKVVVNAYTGKMTAYTIDPSGDPLIRSYAAAFPGLFHPISQMPAALRAHLRYPQDLLELQAAVYGRYHVDASSAANFYALSDAWDLSQTSISENGSPSSPLATNAEGVTLPFTPVYELIQLPGENSLSFDAIEPLVPYSSTGTLKTLSAILTANSDADDYGELTAFVSPRGQSIHGPALANADIESDPNISRQISLLDTHGSIVSLGEVQVLPIADSLLYVRPLYVSSSQTNYPALTYVIVVYGKKVAMEPTLAGALSDVFNASVSVGSSTGTSTITSQASALIQQASSDYAAAEQALARGNLGTYQSDVTAAGTAITEAESLLKSAKSGSSASTKDAPKTSSSSSSA